MLLSLLCLAWSSLSAKPFLERHTTRGWLIQCISFLYLVSFIKIPAIKGMHPKRRQLYSLSKSRRERNFLKNKKSSIRKFLAFGYGWNMPSKVSNLWESSRTNVVWGPIPSLNVYLLHVLLCIIWVLKSSHGRTKTKFA